MKKPNDDFCAGVLACLGVLDQYGKDEIYDAIIATLDVAELVDFARRDGSMRWSGLERIVEEDARQSSKFRSTLESLTADILALREALSPFARLAEEYEKRGLDIWPDGTKVATILGTPLLLSDLRRARDAFK